MKFNKQIKDFFTDVQSMLTHRSHDMMTLRTELSVFGELLDEVEDTLKRINEPMRVAVAGYMKAGKSTLLNAIMREKILYTGMLVTTYTPTWFKYSETESMELVFKDGQRLSKPLSELENWTSIASLQSNKRICDVHYVIIYYPSEILKRMELIDTPGLFSPEDGDSERTIRFLGLKSLKEAEHINDIQTASADAIIYAFSGFFKENDLSAVSAFTSTPINAIGIFTKPDQSYWDAFTPEIGPLQKVKPVVKRLGEELKDSLFCVMPVSALCVEGIADLDADLWAVLHALHDAGISNAVKSLSSENLFLNREVIGTTKEKRERLLKRLGQYGIYCVLHALANGVSQEDMTNYLYALSGIEHVEETILSHFGARSFLIKSWAALERVEKKLHAVQYAVGEKRSPNVLAICNRIQQDIDDLRGKNTFAEFDLLRSFYEGKLSFPTDEDNQNFLELTGENGNDAASRLGLPKDASIDDMLRAAQVRMQRWARLANDMTLPRNVNSAAQTITDGIHDIYFHIDMLTSF